MVDGRLHVVAACDDLYSMPLAVAAVSAVVNAREPSSIHVTVVDCGITPRNRRRIQKSIVTVGGAVTFRALDVPLSRSTVSGGIIPSAAAFARLFVDDLVPADRVVYIDSDTVVRCDLNEIIALLDDDDLIAGVADGQGGGLIRGVQRLEGFVTPEAAESPYLNSGVLAINLAAWRTEDLRASFTDLITRHNFEFADQDVINIACAGRIRAIDSHFNVQTHLLHDLPRHDALDALASAKVIHYTERPKPWHGGSDPDRARWWYEMVDRTDWAGWRPTTLRLAIPKARRGLRLVTNRLGAMSERASARLRTSVGGATSPTNDAP